MGSLMHRWVILDYFGNPSLSVFSLHKIFRAVSVLVTPLLWCWVAGMESALHLICSPLVWSIGYSRVHRALLEQRTWMFHLQQVLIWRWKPPIMARRDVVPLPLRLEASELKLLLVLPNYFSGGSFKMLYPLFFFLITFKLASKESDSSQGLVCSRQMSHSQPWDGSKLLSVLLINWELFEGLTV